MFDQIQLAGSILPRTPRRWHVAQRNHYAITCYGAGDLVNLAGTPRLRDPIRPPLLAPPP